MRLSRFRDQRNQSVNYFSKVYIVHFVFLGKCITECKSKLADVLYILFLLGTLPIGNTGVGMDVYEAETHTHINIFTPD